MFQSIISSFAQCVYLLFVMGLFFNTSCRVHAIEKVTEIIRYLTKMIMFLINRWWRSLSAAILSKSMYACTTNSFIRLELYSSFSLCAAQVDSKISEAFSAKDLNRLSWRETSSKSALSAILSFKGD